MRRVIRPGLLAAFAATLSLASPAAAQDGLNESNGGGFDLRLFRPAVDSKGLITLNGTDILGSGRFSFGLRVSVVRHPGIRGSGSPRGGCRPGDGGGAGVGSSPPAGECAEGGDPVSEFGPPPH